MRTLSVRVYIGWKDEDTYSYRRVYDVATADEINSMAPELVDNLFEDIDCLMREEGDDDGDTDE